MSQRPSGRVPTYCKFIIIAYYVICIRTETLLCYYMDFSKNRGASGAWEE